MPDNRHFDSGLPWFAFALAACAVVAPYWWQDKMPIEIQYGLWVVAALSFVFGLWRSGGFHRGIVKWLIAPFWIPSDKELPSQEDKTPFPDWPIHELFSYLRPDLTDPGSIEWGKVGQEVLDKFRNDEANILRASGRPITSDVPDVFFASQAALDPIPGSYWSGADFTYSFLKGEAGRKPHTTGRPKYADLHVNRDAAVRLWPHPLPSGKALVEDVLGKLAALRELENKLLELTVHDDSSYQGFDSQLQNLRAQIFETIKTYISPAEAKVFWTCGTVPNVSGGYDNEHSTRLGVIFRDVQWLADLINRERRK